MTPLELALTVPCAFCGARVGDPCVTENDRPKPVAHVQRSAAVTDAYAAGYVDGERDGRRSVKNQAAAALTFIAPDHVTPMGARQLRIALGLDA